ncbi:MAG: hypothetical protein A2X86_10925 [Bdellovibrionales bacterium GWA2_49_15]|nr:MAG: hypothetical protein A2X86_10925 [Bdellovibrionales bacterium GWA2_49_15]HAZ11489.1 hypothetical protein [Bdellovibrionales bacterium]
MNIKKLSVILFVFIFFDNAAFAANKQLGLGAVIGAPTGLSLNYLFAEAKSIHSVLAFDFDGRDEISFASHLTWWQKKTESRISPLNWFYGLGGKVVILDQGDHKARDEDFELGPSATVGVSYDFEKAPLEIFLKTNLTLNIIERTDAEMDLMIGLHVYF